MCGISGFIAKSTPNINDNIRAMNAIISHRGPDAEDFYMNEELAFGHRRLSIIDLSDGGKQPMHYLDRYVITYNGEVYNYHELKAELQAEGYTFTNQTDTEVIMAAYDYWQEACLNHFNGMWSFAIYDKKEQLIFCARDRFGIKPFYYYDKQDYFAFGSEIKQFSVLPEWKAILNKQSAYDFLSWSFTDNTEDCFFKGVKQLRASHYLKYDLKNHEYVIKSWYNILQETRVSDTFSVEKAELLQLLKSSVRYRLIADVKVGSCLSGGMDSTSIVMLVNEVLKEQGKHELQETVSACSENSRYDESSYIKEVVDKAKCTNHRVYPSYDSLIQNLDKIIWHQDEPFGSSSIFAQWDVFKTAKENKITVMLDGQGSDEILAGYMQFFGALFIEKLRSFKILELIKEAKAIKNRHKFNNRDLIRFMANAIIKGSYYNQALKLSGKLGDAWLEGTHNIKRYPSWKKSNFSLREESLEQLFYSKLPILLHNEDRNSMAFSIESRVPFLDYRLVEFALNLPNNYKIQEGKTKFILREAMQGILPESIINRHDKMAFVTPEEQWVKENPDFFLKELEETLKLTRGFINPRIKTYFKAVILGKKKFDFTLFRFINFGRWLKIFKVEIEN